MREKLLTLSVGLVVGAFAMYLTCGGGPIVSADCPGEPGKPCGNGDVNGDGKYNLADPIYLLQDLFKQGPDPVAIECPPCDSCCDPCPTRLPATGQTLCYDDVGNVIDCGSTDYPGQDGFYQKGCPMAGRFVDNGDGTVTDNCTGLMWQKHPADVSGDGRYGFEDWQDWQEALQYCDNLELGDYSDWRVPNVRELQSIVDYGRAYPAIDPVFEPGAFGSWYWSSSTDVVRPSYALFVEFHLGEVFSVPKDEHNPLRAVRG